MTWRLTEGSGKAPAEDKKREGPPVDEPLASALEDPRVQAVLDIFGGSVESVDRPDTSEEAQER